MNHAPLINSKRLLALMAVAASCPFVQASTVGYLRTTSATAPIGAQPAVQQTVQPIAPMPAMMPEEGYLTPSTAAGTSEVGPTAVYAGAQDSINSREAARRRADVQAAMQLLQDGRTAYAEKKYSDALENYKKAWNRLPKAPATQKLQEFIVASIGDASIAVAIECSRVGRYDDAEQLLLEVLSRDPNNKRARKELSLLRDPVRNNPALTPEHVKNVEEVQRLLNLGYGQLDLAQYDQAYETFNSVLRIDPYNSAARRGQEAVSRRRSTYYRSAYNSYRARALSEVDALWQESLPTELPEIELGGSVSAPISEGVIRNRENLNNLRIARASFEETPVEDALEFLRAEARKSGMQMNFIFEKPQQAPVPAAASVSSSSDSDEDEDEEDSEDEEEEEAAAPVAVVQQLPPAIISKLELENLTAAELLQRICDSTGCTFRVEENAVVVYQKGASNHRMVRRSWPVRPSFLNSSSDDEEEDESDDDWGGGGSSSGSRLKIDPKAALIAMGVNFPQGATATYSRATGQLTVYNTEDELDAVEEAINIFRQDMPKMVKVSAKFVEISQQNDEELSFDWVINPFSINDAGSAYLGGVSGVNSTTPRNFNDYVRTGGTAYANMHHNAGSWPISSNGTLSSATDTLTNGLMTGGLRTGSGAINTSALQNLVASGSAGASATANPAPGILSLSGIYDSGSFQGIMRGLSQKKGVDIMSAPSLVISSDAEMEYAPTPDPLASDQNDETGCAKIEVIRRFIYPVAYDEPQITSGGSNYNNNNNNNNNGYSGSMPVAAPANPSEWGVEEVGIMMRFQIEPFQKGDGDIVRFKRFEIRVVDFEGFVNYGSPITAGIANENDIEHITLTDNRIDMPIFSRRYINSNPCVYDGHTIAIGGLIEDEVQKVEDKVPVFGDLPLIGRFFRSNAESHVRKNLMIFVTADVIDPFGKPLRQRQTGRGEDAAAAAGALPGLFPDDGVAQP
ncbi:MAG: hypothetical protein IJB00_01980 [Akkermansia sp.]|nr:hypothetical protein [Akkermansia sp.]